MKKKFNILFLSNMMEEKGVWDLVEACKILYDNDIDFECHFVGKWSDIDEYTFYSRINNLSLKNNIFAHGAKYGEEKQRFFDIADLFVFPTYYHNECFPLVLLEAMQNKIACIATREGGIPDVIDDGITGFLVEKHSPEQLSNKIKSVLTDSELCISMGQKGYEKFISEFTLECFETRIKDILSDCVIPE